MREQPDATRIAPPIALPTEHRELAVLLALPSSGLGWTFREYPSWNATDHVVKGSITSVLLHDSPHFAVSLLLVLVVLEVHTRAPATQSQRRSQRERARCFCSRSCIRTTW